MMYMLTMIFPSEFHIDFAGTIENLFRDVQDGQADFAFLSELDITEEILQQLKLFFIQRNFDGKNLFRVLSK